MRILLIALLFAGLAAAQITVNVPSLTVSADGTATLYAWMLSQPQAFETKLTDSVDAVATTIRVDDASGINAAANSLILIGGEAMIVTNKAARLLTVTRAALGTQARAHRGLVTQEVKNPDGSTTTTVVNVGDIVNVMKHNTPARAARQWVIDKMTALMEAGGYPTAVAQDSVINTAKAAKQAAIDAAVQ